MSSACPSLNLVRDLSRYCEAQGQPPNDIEGSNFAEGAYGPVLTTTSSGSLGKSNLVDDVLGA